MNVDQIVEKFKSDKTFMNSVSSWVELPAKKAEYADFPAGVEKKVIEALSQKGIFRLYTHQAEAVQHILAGENVTVVTPTASGKTLCYNIPVVNHLMKDPASRALYLFPTKALAQDQMAELQELTALMDVGIKSYTYDGDTPVNARKAVRQAGNVIITNPDMLHSGILPQHTKWVDFFENLKYVVIDELHMYVGVFGSNVANVIRRLKRLCAFYGSNPQYILLSATIANPKELAEKMIELPVHVVSKNGAPAGKRHIVFVNPPYVNKEFFIRRDALSQSEDIAYELLKNEIQTIVFLRSRVGVEVLYATLSEKLKRRKAQGTESQIRAYRGGYLPSERREIERGLRSGDILGVVSTNALELGIDIGRLDACVMCGYPGGIANTWQQLGRAGRRQETSLAVLVASNKALDQYIIQHPDYFYGASPESGLINADNLQILMSHVQCSLFELPFADGETFGGQDITPLLSFFEENGIARHVAGRWHWMSDSYPSTNISIRSIGSDNYIIIDISDPKRRVIGEMDRYTVPMLLHEQAIYMHQGVQYQVEKLDWDDRKAYVRKVNVDYYTDADMNVEVKVMDISDSRKAESKYDYTLKFGELMIISQASMFKKMKLVTHENLGWGKIFLPQLEMYTFGCWLTIPSEIAGKFEKEQFNDAMIGISSLLGNIAPVYLMCSANDIRILYQVRSPFTNEPTIFLYDNYQGGVGFSEKLYQSMEELFQMAKEHLEACPCEKGCPSCVGPMWNRNIKQNALNILKMLLQGQNGAGKR